MVTDFYIEQATYQSNNQLALVLYDKDTDEEYGVLTVNLNIEGLKSNQQAVDINNMPDAKKIIDTYKLGKVIGHKQSGFVNYPVYEFDIDKIKEYSRTDML